MSDNVEYLGLIKQDIGLTAGAKVVDDRLFVTAILEAHARLRKNVLVHNGLLGGGELVLVLSVLVRVFYGRVVDNDRPL